MRLNSNIRRALLIVFMASISSAAFADEVVDRVVQFLTNVHTGKLMSAEEWLTRKARLEPNFNAYGGLNAMVKQSTARAERNGGLKSVEVLKSSKVKGQYNIKIKVLFNQDPSVSTDAPTAAKEEMIWNITAVKEAGDWKLSF